MEGSWSGRGTSAAGQLRRRARAAVRLLRRPEPDHHAPYSQRMSAALPFAGGGPTPDEAVALVQASGWGPVRIERLRDVEWAVTEGLRPLDALLGTHPRWAVTAGP